MAVNKSGEVIAAGMLGKIKTVTQMLTMISLLLEPVIIPASSPIGGTNLISYILMTLMTIMTVWSGADYFVKFFRAE